MRPATLRSSQMKKMAEAATKTNRAFTATRAIIPSATCSDRPVCEDNQFVTVMISNLHEGRVGRSRASVGSTRWALLYVRRAVMASRCGQRSDFPRLGHDPGTLPAWDVCLLRSFACFAETVADAAHGFDQVGGAELLTQRLDMHVDGAFEYDGAFADGGVHELMPRKRSARLAQ